jgi:hypothetical protein
MVIGFLSSWDWILECMHRVIKRCFVLEISCSFFLFFLGGGSLRCTILEFYPFHSSISQEGDVRLPLVTAKGRGEIPRAISRVI